MNKGKLTKEQLLMKEQAKMQRLQVEEVEMKARYWRAQWEVRYYTLEAEKLQAEYDDYMNKQKEAHEKALEGMKAAIAELNKQAEEGKIVVAENKASEVLPGRFA